MVAGNSAHAHHIAIATGRRLESGDVTDIHIGAAVYVGEDYKVRSAVVIEGG